MLRLHLGSLDKDEVRGEAKGRLRDLKETVRAGSLAETTILSLVLES